MFIFAKQMNLKLHEIWFRPKQDQEAPFLKWSYIINLVYY